MLRRARDARGLGSWDVVFAAVLLFPAADGHVQKRSGDVVARGIVQGFWTGEGVFAAEVASPGGRLKLGCGEEWIRSRLSEALEE